MKNNTGYTVDAGRVMETIELLARISEPGEGVTRLAYTQKGAEARHFIEMRMGEAGLETRVDAAGNLYGTSNVRSGRKLTIASHYDSVPNGGKYDGLLGIAMGIEAARALRYEKLKHALEVVAFDGEESSRFGISCIGSKRITGHLSVEGLKERKDADGVSIYDAMTALVLKPDSVTPWDKSTIDFYIEPHIEQADRLLKAGIPIGIVTGIRAPLRYMVTINGEWAHSGATPMLGRKDANAAASEMTLAVERIATEYEKVGFGTVATAAPPIVKGVSINKVTGSAVLPIDIRGDGAADREDLAETIVRELKRIAGRRGVSMDVNMTEKGTPAKLREQDYVIIEDAAKLLGIRSMRMPSGAGHDAQYIFLCGTPTTVIFVRNAGGSHNPAESVTVEDVEAATRVLVESIAMADAKMGKV